MASAAPPPSLARLFFEPLRGGALIACGLAIWLAGAGYCHGYQRLLTGEPAGPWPGSLLWSAIAVVPWFALFEWSKQSRGDDAVRRPVLLGALVAAIAAASIGLEYAVDFCVGDVTDHFGLLVLRRLPAVGVSVVLIALTRRAVLRRPRSAETVAIASIASLIDWVEAADNYVELHMSGRVTLRRMTMRDAAESLEPHGFVRVHRRFLVNRSRLVAADSRAVRLSCGQELPVGTAFAANLRARG